MTSTLASATHTVLPETVLSRTSAAAIAGTEPAPTLTVGALVPTTATAKGWHPDPEGRHRLRYHDGAAFTEHTTHWGPVPCQGCSHVA